MNVLVATLDDPDGFLRYKAVVAIEKLRREHSDLILEREPIEALVLKETARYYSYLTLRFSLVQNSPDAQKSLLARALDDKLDRTVDRIYRLLGLIYPWKDIVAARYTIEHGDGRKRAAAVEYMDNLVGGAIRKNVMPIIEDCPMEEKVRRAHLIVKTRPGGLEQTVSQLVHDADQVIAAAAIHLVEQRRLWSLCTDLEHTLEHRSAHDWYVFEAASWALAAHTLSEKRRDLWTEPLPAVELADRLRTMPLFKFVSVDELFRIAGAGRQVRHEGGRELYHEGALPDEVQFLLDGSVHVSADDDAAHELEAPAMLAFENMLEGSPLRLRIRAVDRTVCLALRGDEFLTMLSDNIVMAQGLFRMLLNTPKTQHWRTVYGPKPDSEPLTYRSLPLQPLEKVLVLRENPLLERATVSQLLELAAVTREVALASGSVLFNETDPPALYYVLNGEIRLDGDGASVAIATRWKHHWHLGNARRGVFGPPCSRDSRRAGAAPRSRRAVRGAGRPYRPAAGGIQRPVAGA